MKILIAGGTGIVGTQLSKDLIDKGHQVRFLSRKQIKNPSYYLWDVENSAIDSEAFVDIDCIINLAGENIADKKWTKERKQKIIDSRVKSTALIHKYAKAYASSLCCYISASAIGYYGAVTTEKIFTEEDKNHNDFLGETCKAWEDEVFKFENYGTRINIFRIGVVLSNKGAFLSKMVMLTKLRLNSVLGNGKQYIPWIHIEDLSNMIIHCIDNKHMQGIYNAVSGEHITNKELTNKLYKHYKITKLAPPIPAFILKLLFGEMSSIFLKGSKVSNSKIVAENYCVKYKTFEDALNDLYPKL
jgi:uncharacterized protein (TIGR01777 family)